jgi:nardilysin
MGELLLTLPVADAHTLSLVWPLPPLRAYYQYATDDYISHILGHEGPGSLTSQYVANALPSPECQKNPLKGPR